MSITTIILGISIICGFISVLSIIISVYTAKALQKNTVLPEIFESKLRTIDQDLTDLSDRVTHWMRRIDMRRVREAKEVPQEVPEVHDKNSLRRTVALARFGGQKPGPIE